MQFSELTKNLLTSRLRLEFLKPHHAPTVLDSLQNELIYRYMPEAPPTLDELTRRYEFLSHGRSPDQSEYWLNWIGFRQTDGRPIGTFQASLKPGIEGTFAYIVFPDYWRQGFASEMAHVVFDHIFGLGVVPQLSAEIDTRNKPSIALVESLGLTRVSLSRDADFFDGETSHEYTYTMTKSDWLGR